MNIYSVLRVSQAVFYVLYCIISCNPQTSKEIEITITPFPQMGKPGRSEVKPGHSTGLPGSRACAPYRFIGRLTIILPLLVSYTEKRKASYM